MMNNSMARINGIRLNNFPFQQRTGDAKYVELAMVQECRFGSGSGSNPNHGHIGGRDCQPTRTINSGTVRCKAPNLYELGGLSVGRPAGPSVDSYNALAFAV